MKNNRTFIDSLGNAHSLDPEWRNQLHPNWQSMLNPGNILPQTPESAKSNVYMWAKKLIAMEGILNIYGGTFKNRSAIEIGCYDGATSYALAYLGASLVIGTDMAKYYVNQDQHKTIQDSEINAKEIELGMARNSYRKIIPNEIANNVIFIEDDICTSKLQPNSADFIFSYEVLEHILDPKSAFVNMANTLKSGGMMFHEYNPFFCITGGHSLASAEFPWGHTRLTAEDYKRMIEESRPSEIIPTMRFYENALNRMTLEMLKYHLEDAGLNIISITPFSNIEHAKIVTTDILTQSQHVHKTLTLSDLISPYVWVLAQKSI